MSLNGLYYADVRLCPIHTDANAIKLNSLVVLALAVRMSLNFLHAIYTVSTDWSKSVRAMCLHPTV